VTSEVYSNETTIVKGKLPSKLTNSGVIVTEHQDETNTQNAPATNNHSRRLHWALRSVFVALTLVGALIALAPTQPDEQAYMLAATQARRVYRYDRALHFYALAATQAPNDPQPICDSGDVYTMQQQWRQARAAYQQCLTLAPANAQAWYLLGETQDALGVITGAHGALAAWQRAAALGYPLAWRRLAGRAEYQRDFSQAATDWAHVIALLPSKSSIAAEAQAHLGLIALWRGDTTDAQATFARASAASPTIAAWLRQFDFALYAIVAPQTADQYERLGYVYLSANLPAFALAPLTRAVALAPAVGSAHAFLGWTLWTLGLRQPAEREIALGLRLAPKLSFACFAAGEVAASDGLFTHALALFTQGLATDAKNPVLWSEAGRMELALANYVAAAHDMRLAAQLSGDPAYSIALVSFYVTHGLGLTPNDPTGDALATALAAAQRWPTNEALWYLLGQLYDTSGQQTYAYYAFTQAQALDPTDPGPYLYLGRYAANEGAYAQAALELRTGLALRPSGPLASQFRMALAPLVDVSV